MNWKAILGKSKAIIGGAAITADALVGSLAPHSWPWVTAEVLIAVAGALGIYHAPYAPTKPTPPAAS